MPKPPAATTPRPLPLRVPPRLRAGARVALLAPAGPLANDDELARSVANTERLGWEPVVMPHALARHDYLAGPDDVRLADLARALADPTIDALWCVRGGYGAMRLLPALAADAITARPRALIGFSDITALHAAWQRAGLVSFHGPTARGDLTPFSEDALRRAVVAEFADAPLGGSWPAAEVVRSGRARGVLAGGNLALLAALCGTPWAPRFRGAIAVLEDVGERPYRIDRLLTQLRLAGAFDGCLGIAAGHCTACSEDAPATGADPAFRDRIAELADGLGVPALVGLPIGHIAEQWTLPFGVVAELDADARALIVPPHPMTPDEVASS